MTQRTAESVGCRLSSLLLVSLIFRGQSHIISFINILFLLSVRQCHMEMEKVRYLHIFVVVVRGLGQSD